MCAVFVFVLLLLFVFFICLFEMWLCCLGGEGGFFVFCCLCVCLFVSCCSFESVVCCLFVIVCNVFLLL